MLMYEFGRAYDKAQKSIVGFELDGKVFIKVFDGLPTAYLYEKRMSRGRGYCIALRLGKKARRTLVDDGAYLLCEYKDFKGGYNRGDTLEKMIYSKLDKARQHDNLPFYKGVDIEINGVGYSIKWQHSQVYAYSTLVRLAQGEC